MQKVNGYTIVAAEFNKVQNWYTILGVANVHNDPQKFAYVTARMENLTDSEWFWGSYMNTLDRAVESYNTRKAM